MADVASLVGALGLAVASSAVVWLGSGLLERSTARLSALYGLPPVVEGAVVIAVGSSFPELSTTVISTLLHGEFDLGVGAIVGSAIFNILIVPALAGLSADSMEANRDLVFKESLFYMLSVAVLVITFSLAVIYEPVAGERLAGSITRSLALVPVALYGLYVFVQWSDVAESSRERATGESAWKEWGLLVAGLALIVVSVEGLVRAAIDLGQLAGTPSYVWGLTVVAAATSLPDAFVSLRAARRDREIEALANVLGSNIFDLCVAIPAGVLVAGATVVDFAAAIPMFGALTFATVLLFTFMRTDLELENWEAVALLVAYGAFVVFVLETGGVVNLA